MANTEVPLYVLNVTYPLVDDEVMEFCEGKEHVLVVEEGQPAYIEQAVGRLALSRRRRSRTARQGHLPDGRRVYTARSCSDGMAKFVRQPRPEMLSRRRAGAQRPTSRPMPDLAKTVPFRGRRASAPAAPSGRSSRR